MGTSSGLSGRDFRTGRSADPHGQDGVRCTTSKNPSVHLIGTDEMGDGDLNISKNNFKKAFKRAFQKLVMTLGFVEFRHKCIQQCKNTLEIARISYIFHHGAQGWDLGEFSPRHVFFSI
jgi:hypothetical protein